MEVRYNSVDVGRWWRQLTFKPTRLPPVAASMHKLSRVMTQTTPHAHPHRTGISRSQLLFLIPWPLSSSTSPTLRQQACRCGLTQSSETRWGVDEHAWESVRSQTAGLQPASEEGWQEDRSGLKERSSTVEGWKKKDKEETRSVNLTWKKRNERERKEVQVAASVRMWKEKQEF